MHTRIFQKALLSLAVLILVGLFMTSCSSGHGSGKHRNHMKNDMGW
jgi:hypothetical protein